MSVRQYVISDPRVITFRQYIKDTNGTQIRRLAATDGKALYQNL